MRSKEFIESLSFKDKQKILRGFYSLKNANYLADLLGTDVDTLLGLSLKQSNYHYFYIPKKNGGFRFICAPEKALLEIQQKLNCVLNLIYKPKSSAHGFVLNRSIITNARYHINKAIVLNVDLENFFPSVNFGRVIGLFKSKPYGLPENVAMLLADIVCCDNYLPQGAPTSPVVTNMICRGLDDNLMQLAKRYKCFYTRYADDITFSTSGRFISKSFVLDLKSVIREEGFKINEKKFRIQNRLQRQEVTGLVVNEKLNVNRKYIRKVRAILNNWERNGVLAASKQYFRKFDRHRNDGVPNFIFSVKGKIDFIGMIRGYDDEIYKKMAKKWKSLRLIGFKF